MPDVQFWVFLLFVALLYCVKASEKLHGLLR
jgi:hypothetical protein